MKYFEEYYVGFSKERYNNTEDQRILGFATPKDRTKAYEKRKNTVDSWSDNDIESKVIENTPQYGFKLLESFKRYKGNKGYRLFDPRGFELEISVENMLDVILSCTIAKGLITDKMVWMRNGAQNWLVSEDNSAYKERNNLVKKTSALNIGTFYVHPAVDTIYYKYLGKVHYNMIHKDSVNNYDRPPSRYGYNYHARKVLSSDISFEIIRPDHKVHLYQEYHLTDGELSSATLHIRKSPIINLIESPSTPDIVKDYQTVLYNDLKTYDKSHSRNSVRDVQESIITTLSSGIFSTSYIFFETKEDSKSQQYTLEYLVDKMTPYHTYERGGYVKSLDRFGFDIIEKLFEGDTIIEVNKFNTGLDRSL